VLRSYPLCHSDVNYIQENVRDVAANAIVSKQFDSDQRMLQCNDAVLQLSALLLQSSQTCLSDV